MNKHFVFNYDEVPQNVAIFMFLCVRLWSWGTMCFLIEKSCIISRILGQDANIWTLEMWSICNLVVGHITNENYYKWAQSNDYLSFRIHRLSCLWWWVGWSWRPGKQEFWLYRKKSSDNISKIINIKQFIKIYAHKFHKNLCMSMSYPILSSHALLALTGVNKKPFAWSA